jgi:sterol desaturase/sphingolipid hydroxylase (fatty acid hydroxylase superfamily)
MGEWLLAREAQIFVALYLGAICTVAVMESFCPRRPLCAPMARRWLTNIALALIDIGVVRLVFPFLGVGAALWAQAQGLGLLYRVTLPEPVALVFALAMLDLGRYLLHVLLHRLPLLWRLHRIHHSDPDYDFSTGLRFHPIEALFSAGFDLGLILLLGPPPLAVALYGFLVAIWAILSHGNLHLPQGLDAALRWALVTPDLHRTHHSADVGESLTNYGGVTPLWDRLFGTYRVAPALGHEQMRLGIAHYPPDAAVRLGVLLTEPLRAPNRQLPPGPP